jgi:hypothetical protein
MWIFLYFDTDGCYGFLLYKFNFLYYVIQGECVCPFDMPFKCPIIKLSIWHFSAYCITLFYFV